MSTPAAPKTQGFTWTVEDSNLITAHETWGDILVEAGKRDPRIVCLTADLARSTKIGRFEDAFPERFVNVGIAEQNLIAVASGMAAAGLRPVVSTYATFASLRAAEFVRTDLAYNRRAVVIVGTLAGVSFGQGGPTHHALEDVALMRAIPGMTVLAPADGREGAKAVQAALALEGPSYIRMGRGMEPPVHASDDFPFALGKALRLREGSDATVIACGVAVLHALRAAERAARAGKSVGVLDVHTLKPLDEEAIRATALSTRRIVTAEDHSVIGGLGSAVAEVIAASGKGCALRRLGHQDRFSPMGVAEDLVHQAGFDEDGILAALEDVMRIAVAKDDDWEDRA